MCLLVKPADFYINRSLEKITCYKILILDDGKWVTPYQGMEVSNDMLVIKDSKFKIEETIHNLDYAYSISGGGFHAFRTLEAAKKDFTAFYLVNSYYKKNMKIFEATVPPLTFYIEGETEDGLPCICAKKLILKDFYKKDK